jgi:hypothetical protein
MPGGYIVYLPGTTGSAALIFHAKAPARNTLASGQPAHEKPSLKEIPRKSESNHSHKRY